MKLRSHLVSGLISVLLGVIPAVAQEYTDTLFFKDGSTQLIKLLQNKKSDDYIWCTTPDSDGLVKFSKRRLSKVVLEGGYERSVEINKTGQTIIGLGGGLPFSSISLYQIVPVWTMFDICVHDFVRYGRIGTGLAFNYSQQKLGSVPDFKAIIIRPSAELFVSYRFSVIDRLDLFVRAGAGLAFRTAVVSRSVSKDYNTTSEKTEQDNFGLSMLIMPGISFALSPSVSIATEVGYHDGGQARLGLYFTL